MRKLEEIRKDINEIDEKIQSLLNKRFDLSKEVRDFKIENNIKILDQKRENEILENIEKSNEKYGKYLKNIYKNIMDESKNLQKKQRYGLLGKKLGHSFSKKIHEKIADYEYEYFEKEKNQLDEFFEKKDFKSINVTIPYKKDVIKYLDIISDKAKKIGAVNTIVNKNSKLYGYNTDYDGFLYNLKSHNIDIKNKKCLILGKGATSKTVRVVLEDLGAKEIVNLSRRFKPYFSSAKDYNDFQIIINTTPVGMYPNNDKFLEDINLGDFKNLEAVIDCIYNPFMTKILIDAKDRNLKYASGIDMLIAQAIKAIEYFKDVKSDNENIRKIKTEIYKENKNIALIGMPSAGKSTIALVLKEKLNRKLVDIDKEFVKRYGNIEEFFKKNGEEKFRDIEENMVEEFAKETSLIIACGGGVVLREKNYYSLKENSFVVEIKRDIKELKVEGRPISKANNLNDLYEKRYKKYERFADDFVYNNKEVSRVSDEIIRKFYENIGD